MSCQSCIKISLHLFPFRKRRGRRGRWLSGTLGLAVGSGRKRGGRTWVSGTIASGCKGRRWGRNWVSFDFVRVGSGFVDDVCKSWFLGRSCGLVQGSGFFRFEDSSISGIFCFICCGTLVIFGNYLATDILHSANNSIFGRYCAIQGHLSTSFCSGTGFISSAFIPGHFFVLAEINSGSLFAN